MKKVVTVGGGTGSYTLLMGLKKYDDLDISAIVSMADDGGSTGRLRDELGVLPPGDVRQCLVALSEHTHTVRALMNYRFEDGGLQGHSFGNIFLAALEKVAGSFVSGVEVASDILKIRGSVIPVTEDVATLAIKLSNEMELIGEDSINHGDLQSAGVRSLYFKDNVGINKHAAKAILEADAIVLGPGNFYCSILPNLIVSGFIEAIKDTKAKIIVPVNLTNKKDHTLHWKTSDYINVLESMLGKKVDIILVNTETPSEEQISVYRLEEGDGVMVENDINDSRVVRKDLLSREVVKHVESDAVQAMRSFIRHDSNKLAEAIVSLL